MFVPFNVIFRNQFRFNEEKKRCYLVKLILLCVEEVNKKSIFFLPLSTVIYITCISNTSSLRWSEKICMIPN